MEEINRNTIASVDYTIPWVCIHHASPIGTARNQNSDYMQDEFVLLYRR